MRRIILAAICTLLLVVAASASAQTAIPPQIVTPTNSPIPPTPTIVVPPATATGQEIGWLVIIPPLLTFLAAVVASCAWPVTVLSLLVVFRKPILELVEDLKLLRFKDVEFEFGKRVQKLEQEADEAQLPPAVSPSPSESIDLPASERVQAEVLAEYEKRLYRLAEANPRGAVIEAWLLVESAVRQAAQQGQIDATSRTPFNRVLSLLQQHEVVEPKILKLISQLKGLRNYAVHESDFSISTSEISDYIDVSLRVSNALRK